MLLALMNIAVKNNKNMSYFHKGCIPTDETEDRKERGEMGRDSSRGVCARARKRGRHSRAKGERAGV